MVRRGGKWGVYCEDEEGIIEDLKMISRKHITTKYTG